MGRGPVTFRQQDVTRALRARRAAGVEVERIEIEKGKIIVITEKKAKAPTDAGNDGNEWD
jgi:coenzyme F420-reducing hydrogenase beta subunit